MPTNPIASAPLQLDWRLVYRERLELDKRWNGTVRTESRNPFAGIFDEEYQEDLEMKENMKPWEPETRSLTGHADR